MLSDQDDIWHRNKAEKFLLGMNYLLDRCGSDCLAVTVIYVLSTIVEHPFLTRLLNINNDPTKDSCLSSAFRTL